MSAAPTLAMMIQGKDPKTAVNQFCQKYCTRPIQKDDVVYKTSKFPTGHQTILRLNCIDGQEFAGEPQATAKDAEKSACQQVLNFYADSINNMSIQKKGKKRAAASTPAGQTFVPFTPGEPATKVAKLEAPPDPNAGKTCKSELNALFSKIARRVMGKNEVIYETLQVQGGYQSTVRMPGLPDQWGSHIWAGEVMAKKGDSEQSVAGIALAEIQTHPSFQKAMTSPSAKEKSALNWKLKGGSSKGKGKGKGEKGGSSSAIVQAQDTTGIGQGIALALAAAGYPQSYAAAYTQQLQAQQGFSQGFSRGFS